MFRYLLQQLDKHLEGEKLNLTQLCGEASLIKWRQHIKTRRVNLAVPPYFLSFRGLKSTALSAFWTRCHPLRGDTLLVLPKDNSGEVVAVDRNGQIESTFSPERYEYLMERFAIAYEQMQMAEYQQDSDRDLELS